VCRVGWCAVWLLSASAAGGCGRHDNTAALPTDSLTPAQEAATKDYVAILEQQIQMVEESAGILATVREDPATKDAARGKLVQLAVENDALDRRVRERQPADLAVIMAARQRLADRQQQAAQKRLAEVQRINRMPGGEDFFQKELRPLLDAVKGR